MKHFGSKAILLTLLLVPGGMWANEEEHAGAVEHRHRAEVFLGVAHEGSADEFAAGLAYEYRISSLVGIGVFAEHAGEEEEAWTFGMPVFFHPYHGVRLLLAPGWETKEVEVEEGAAHGEEHGAGGEVRRAEKTEDEDSFLLRTGIAYEFEIGRWSITPEFNVDFIEGGHQVLVYGVSLGCGI